MYIDPSGNFVFFVAQTYIYNSFFSIVENLNISAIYKSIILCFSENLPSIYRYIRKKLKSNNQEKLENIN